MTSQHTIPAIADVCGLLLQTQQPGLSDGRVLSREPCKNRRTNRHAVWNVDSGGSREPRVKGGPDTPYEAAIMRRERGGPLQNGLYAVSRANTTGPIKILFGTWTRLGPRKHVLDQGVCWRHLMNTTDLSVCGSDVALCQITFTTCYH